MTALLLAVAWQTAPASFYDTGRITADGTRMSVRGKWVATYLAPLGSVLEVCGGGGCHELVVRDRTAKRFGHRLDIPRDTWRAVTGASLKRGVVPVKWRIVRRGGK